MRKTNEALFEVCHIGEFIPVNSQRRLDCGTPLGSAVDEFRARLSREAKRLFSCLRSLRILRCVQDEFLFQGGNIEEPP